MNTQDNRVGICAICGTIHVNENGFEEDRLCDECGEGQVYSIVEYRDIAIDWQRQKDEIMELHKLLQGDYA